MVLTYKQLFNKKHKFPLNQSHSLEDISKISGYKLSGLKTIFDKGLGAYVTNPESVRPHIKSATEWAFARVYASINPKSKSYQVDKTHLKKK